jgi:hypothetical protein
MLRGVLKGPKGYFQQMTFSPDGKLAAAGVMQGDAVYVFDVATRKQKVRLQMPAVNYGYHLAFSADGRTLVSEGREDAMIRTWHVPTGRQVREVKKPAAVFMGFAPGGKRMVLSERGFAKGLGLYDTATGALVRQLKDVNYCQRCAFSRDGRVLATHGSSGEIQLWDTKQGVLLRELVGKQPRGGNATMTLLTFSPDGVHLATAGHNFGDMHVWEVGSGKQRLHLTSKGFFVSVAFSPDGTLLAHGSTEGLALHDLLNGKDLWRLGHPVRGQFVAFSPDGALLAVAGQTAEGEASITLYDMPRQRHEPLPRELGAEQLEALWADLAVDNDFRLQRVIAGLRAAPTHTVPFLAKKLHPVPGAQLQRVKGLLKDLDDDNAEKRDQAMTSLQQEAAAFEPLLAEVRRDAEPGEVRNRVERILGRQRAAAVPRPLLTELRAVTILEQIGSAQARAVLRALAGGAAGARLTEEARQALER